MKAMEFVSPIYLTISLAILLVTLLYLNSLATKRRRAQKCLPPEAAGVLPLIGHLHLLRGPQLPHITLSNLSEKHGPIFTIRLGMKQGLIVNNWELAKECLTTNDIVLSTRPQTTALKRLCYDAAMFGFHTHDAYWRDMRKIMVTNLLANIRDVRETELKPCIKSLYEACVKSETQSATVDMKRWLWDVTFKLVFRIVAGSTREMDLSEREKWRSVAEGFFALIGVPTVSDVIPFWPRWLDWGVYKKALKTTARDMDILLQKWLDEHKQKQYSNEKFETQDFMDVMLPIIDEVAEEYPLYDGDTIIKSTCLGMLLGGIDGAAVSLTWTISLLLNHPHIFKRAQQELDMLVGRQRQVKESDIEKLVYLQSVIKESLRLYPPAQLIPARESMNECTIGGYNVPIGTNICFNLYKIHRDPRVWSNPNEFVPERFLNTHKNVDVKGTNFELLPFGGGRRMCPGVSFSIQVMQFTLACLLHGFDLSTPSGEMVDMTLSFGATNIKEKPLEVVLTPRLESHLYE